MVLAVLLTMAAQATAPVEVMTREDPAARPRWTIDSATCGGRELRIRTGFARPAPSAAWSWSVTLDGGRIADADNAHGLDSLSRYGLNRYSIRCEAAGAFQVQVVHARRADADGRRGYFRQGFTVDRAGRIVADALRPGGEDDFWYW